MLINTRGITRKEKILKVDRVKLIRMLGRRRYIKAGREERGVRNVGDKR